jgi:hypothetical protein
MFEFSVYVHSRGNSISTTVDAATADEAKAAGIARFVEVMGYQPTGGLVDAEQLRPARIKAPFVAVGLVLVDVD